MKYSFKLKFFPVRSAGRPLRIRQEPMPSTSSAPPPVPVNRSPVSNIPDLLSNLAMIAAATNEAVAVSSSTHHTFTSPPNRSPRRRNNSDSNCEETKISITAVVNHTVGQWNQVGVSLPKIPEGSQTASSLTQVGWPFLLLKCGLHPCMHVATNIS